MSRQDNTYPVWMARWHLWPYEVNAATRRACWRGVILLGAAWWFAHLSPPLPLDRTGAALTVHSAAALRLLVWTGALRLFVLAMADPLLLALLGGLLFMQFQKAPVIVQLFSGIAGRLAYLPVSAAAVAMACYLAVLSIERPLIGVPVTLGAVVLIGLPARTLAQRWFAEHDPTPARIGEQIMLGAALALYILAVR